jgi:hypothetical protein
MPSTTLCGIISPYATQPYTRVNSQNIGQTRSPPHESTLKKEKGVYQVVEAPFWEMRGIRTSSPTTRELGGQPQPSYVFKENVRDEYP